MEIGGMDQHRALQFGRDLGVRAETGGEFDLDAVDRLAGTRPLLDRTSRAGRAVASSSRPDRSTSCSTPSRHKHESHQWFEPAS
jgi:tyrosyl-tRNA synthetase